MARLSRKRLVLLARNLATMLEAGLPVSRALEVLTKQARSAHRRMLLRARSAIERGDSLAEAFGRTRAFPPLFLRMVEVGEASGSVDAVLAQMAGFYDFQRRLWLSFLGQIALPGLQYVAAIGVVAVALYIMQLFGTHAGDPVTIVLLGYGMPAAAIAAYVLLGRYASGARFVHELVLAVPVVGGIARSLAIARFSFVLQLTIGAGVPISECLRRAFESTGNAAFLARYGRARAAMDAGEDLTTSLSRTRLFPLEFTEMVHVAEQAGKLVERFRALSGQYAERARLGLRALGQIAARVVWLGVAAVTIYFIFRMFARYAAALQGAAGV
jgi:type IV pilus assembly protein PilC